jgi:hypothetical protein
VRSVSPLPTPPTAHHPNDACCSFPQDQGAVTAEWEVSYWQSCCCCIIAAAAAAAAAVAAAASLPSPPPLLLLLLLSLDSPLADRPQQMYGKGKRSVH